MDIPESIRLNWFDWTRGQPAGAAILIRELGALRGGKVIAKLKYREQAADPFAELNRLKPPGEKEKLSQQQMRPVILLYGILQEEGMRSDEAIAVLRRIVHEVAVKFLKYNVPLIRRPDWEGRPLQEKQERLDRIAGRFFNVISENAVTESDEFSMCVTHCHFASYCRELGVPELGPLFCEADRAFFDDHQPDIRFRRTQTLAKDGKPCDFAFGWKDQEAEPPPD